MAQEAANHNDFEFLLFQYHRMNHRQSEHAEQRCWPNYLPFLSTTCHPLLPLRPISARDPDASPRFIAEADAKLYEILAIASCPPSPGEPEEDFEDFKDLLRACC